MKVKQTRTVAITLNDEEATRLERMAMSYLNAMREKPKVDADQEQFVLDLHACLTSSLRKVDSNDLR